jgi:uncharacterized protein YndB with AHSA1/START domain
VTRVDQDVVLHRSYPDPVGEVWSAFTESDRLARWIGSYTGTGRPGGTVEFTVTGEVDAGGEVAAPATVTIHECVAPRRLVVEFPGGDSAWHVRVELTPTDRGTDVVFTQRLVPGISAADIEAGWSWYLDRLGADLPCDPMPAWSDYAP